MNSTKSVFRKLNLGTNFFLSCFAYVNNGFCLKKFNIKLIEFSLYVDVNNISLVVLK